MSLTRSLPPTIISTGMLPRTPNICCTRQALARFYLPAGERDGVIAAYDDCLNYIDSQVGELLRFLERSPDWSNTYVIITADHGEAFGEHDTYTHAWNLYREVVHVPLIIAGPGIPQGVRVRDIARTRQIFSTALEMAGMKSAVLRRNSLMRLWESRLAAEQSGGTHNLGSG